MPKNLLTQRQFNRLKPSSWLNDGGGLALKVDAHRSACWIMRKRINKKLHSAGLGSYPEVSIDDARQRRDQIITDLRKGRSWEAAKSGHKEPTPGQEGLTFITYARSWLKRSKPIVEGGTRTNRLWLQRIDTFCLPLHDRFLHEITARDVRDVLDPIWQSKAETAKRVRHHLGAIFSSARFEGLCSGNPAEWQEGLINVMPKQTMQVVHHAAMPYRDVPDFYLWLEAKKTISARCLQFLILTGVRQTEARGAAWNEFDFSKRIWIIPASRMKKTDIAQAHRVPLTDEMMRVLSEARKFGKHYRRWSAVRENALWYPERSDLIEGVWPFRMQNSVSFISETSLRKVLKNVTGGPCTLHGFRTSLRVWLAEVLEADEIVSEAVLAHKNPNKTQRAYLRTDYFDQRRPLMEKWSDYVTGGSIQPTFNPFGSETTLTPDMVLDMPPRPRGRPRKIVAETNAQ